MDNSANNSNDQLLDGLLGDFLDESTGLLHTLNVDSLRLDDLIKASATPLEPAAHSDLLNEMFRAAHSLKGLSGMMRLSNINGLVHKVENIFDAARNGTLTLTTEIVDLVLQAIDRLENMIDLLKAGSSDEVTYQDVVSGIERVLGVDSAQTRRPEINAITQLDNITAAVELLTSPESLPVATLDGIADDRDIPKKYIAIFVDESEQTLDEISAALISGPEAADTSVLLTTCHRLKGSAASIGLHRIARVAHRMEDVLQDLRLCEKSLTPSLADALLVSVDAIRAYVIGLKTGVTHDGLSEALRQLNCVTVALSQPSAANTELRTRNITAEKTAVKSAATFGTVGFVGQIVFEKDLPLSELKAQLALERLHRHGRLFHCQPPEDQIEHLTNIEQLIFGIATDAPSEDLAADLQIQGVVGVELDPLDTASPMPVRGEAAQSAPAADSTNETQSGKSSGNSSPSVATATTKPSETLRVDIERLDQLMSLAGQLVINKARFTQIGVRLKELTSFKSALNSVSAAHETAKRMSILATESCGILAGKDLHAFRSTSTQLCADLDTLRTEIGNFTDVRCTVNDLNEAVHQLHRVSDGIQSTVMDTRMVPIGPLFARFKRVVRDLSRDNHKKIELQISGEGTELDKRMIDELGDPLIHLIRNSADHGIELPEDRMKAGKPALGTITLNAFHRGNRIVIQIADDGRGLNLERIREKALSKGLITDAEAERLTSKELYRLIWKPGFSTAERVTEVSGRGMGMDIVQSKIEQLNGVVDVVSEPGAGTRFEIKLPLTMAIVPSLLTVVGKDVFAIPVESILEIVQIPTTELRTVQGKLTARVRDRITSVVSLDELFSWRGEPSPPVTTSSVTTMVVVGNDGNELALAVDNLLGEQDVVIKSLEENFQNVIGLAGASILGDGSVSLILDIQALLSMARTQTSATGQAFTHENQEVLVA